MSYTKMNVEIETWLKSNNLPYKGNSKDSPKETQKRLKAYQEGRDVIFKKWLSEKKYKELISVAHQGWFSESEFFIPLAKYFIAENELLPLKFLCERGIRFAIEDTISALKHMYDEYPKTTIAQINSIDLEKYASNKEYNSVANSSKWRKLALDRINRYIVFLEQLTDDEYLEYIRAVRDKISSIEVKKKDLSRMKNKLAK